VAQPRKIVKVTQSDYDEACGICEREGRTLGDSIVLVALRRFQKETLENSPSSTPPVKKQIRFPSGRILELTPRS
jgi:hypothetical protein